MLNTIHDIIELRLQEVCPCNCGRFKGRPTLCCADCNPETRKQIAIRKGINPEDVSITSPCYGEGGCVYHTDTIEENVRYQLPTRCPHFDYTAGVFKQTRPPDKVRW